MERITRKEKELILFSQMLAYAAVLINRKDEVIADFERRANADPDKTDAEHMDAAIKSAIVDLAENTLESMRG